MTKRTKKPADLGDFEGAAVVGATLILRGTGDGLSQAMEIAPVKMHVGEIVNLVIEAEVVGIRHDAADKESDALTRVHILRAGVSTIVDSELVHDVLEAQRVAIEKAKGVERLPFEGEEPPRRDVGSGEVVAIGDAAKEVARKAAMAARKAKAAEAGSDG